MLKRINKVFVNEQQETNYFYKNYNGRNDVYGYDIRPTRRGNYRLYIIENESNGFEIPNNINTPHLRSIIENPSILKQAIIEDLEIESDLGKNKQNNTFIDPDLKNISKKTNEICKS